jgi:hypothetical protein
MAQALDQLLKEIVSMTKTESMDLEQRGKAGDLDALKKWVLYSGWEKIEQDRNIKPKVKVRLFKHILQLVQLSAEATSEDIADDSAEDLIEEMTAPTPPTADQAPLHVHDPVNVAGTVICKGCGVQNFG